jgi:energy-converting hydrogenase B subunit D
MSGIGGGFDGVLAMLLLFLGVAILIVPDLFKAVILFIVFGLLLSLAWVRLQAPDIALAEAAIGAGLTGVLFLNALGQMRVAEGNQHMRASDQRHADDDERAI